MTPSDLLELQQLDTERDQLLHRRAHLDERAALGQATAARRSAESEVAALEAEIEKLTSTIEAAEARGEELTEHRTRLQAQLKTIVAPREAEALMSEIETINSERSELDDAELAALERQAVADDELAAGRSALADRSASQVAAEAELAVAEAAIDCEVAALDEQIVERRRAMDEATAAHYDRLRSSMGIAVASLSGKVCQGCFMELTPTELDRLTDTPEGHLAECPQCGRLLAV